jgi:hypothetical protein
MPLSVFAIQHFLNDLSTVLRVIFCEAKANSVSSEADALLIVADVPGGFSDSSQAWYSVLNQSLNCSLTKH